MVLVMLSLLWLQDVDDILRKLTAQKSGEGRQLASVIQQEVHREPTLKRLMSKFSGAEC
jgi:hypothetical protein